MRAILTPLFIFATLLSWGQDFEHPAIAIDPAALQEAHAIWQEQQQVPHDIEGTEMVPASLSTLQSRGDRSNITSVARGIWSEANTWDCNCVPTAGDNVFVAHEVSMIGDVEFHSLLIQPAGTLLDLVGVTMTFSGNFGAFGASELNSTTLVANDILGNQVLDGNMTLGSLSVQNTTLNIEGSVTVKGNLDVDNSTVNIVDALGELTLTENEQGRATVMRSPDAQVLGLVTRQIILPAIANRATPFVQHRITLGLEGVAVSELVGDFPTIGFAGADVEAGNANIAYWSADAWYNYQQVGSADDILPVWEGLYLSLQPDETYTLTFSGTMPAREVSMEVAAGSFTGLFGNTTHGNYDLEQFDAQLGQDRVALRCWNTNTLQWDIYVDGLSTNGMGTTLQPSVACEYTPTDAAQGQAFSLNSSDATPNGTFATSSVTLDGSITFAVSNPSGFGDECKVAISEGASLEFNATEDGVNATSPYSACDLYLEDALANKHGIAQVDFDREPIAAFELTLGANAPFDGAFSIEVTNLDWNEGCVFIQLTDEAEPQPLEMGALIENDLSSGENHTYIVGTLYLLPPSRVEFASPGCEGEGPTQIEVLPTGDGPWSVTLTDAQENSFEGTLDDEGVGVMFGDLASGTYTYAIDNQGTMGCGAVAGAHTVIRPTSMAIATDVTHDCGDGGTVVANVATEDVTYDWSHGATGAEISGLQGGTYTVVATNDFGCKDTLDVTVLSAPEVLVTSTDGTCDGIEDAEIEVDAMHESARYNVILRDEVGVEVDAQLDQETPLFFDNVSTGIYTVEMQLLGAYGCAPETEEVSVVQPVPMTLTSASQPMCDSDQLGSASTTLLGGTGAVTYMWSNGTQEANLTNVEAGEYTVTVTDEAGCQKSTGVTVALSPQLDVTAVSPGCDGTGVAGFNMTSTSGATWTVDVYNQEGTLVESITASEDFDVTNLPTGTYTVTYSDDVNDGCPAKSTEATLTEASDLEVAVTTTPMTCGEHDAGAIDLEVSGGSGDITVAWDHGAEGTSLSGLAGGQYYAVVTDDNGCTKDVRVMVEDSPTVEANFTAPSAGLTDGVNGMTMSFTNTSEGNITGQTWYFGDTETPSYDFHATHTFEAAGAYDVFLNVWNDKCSHTVRKTVVASQGEGSTNDDLGNLVTNVAEGNLTEIHAPVTTESGWMMDLGPAGEGMKVHVFDLTGRQLCTPVGADGNGQIWIEGDQWPALVLLRLVHEPTNSIRTWKMVR